MTLIRIFLIVILGSVGIQSVYATSEAVIHLDLISGGIKEGSNVTFSGILTTTNGTLLSHRTIFIEDDTSYTRPDIILAITTTDSDGNFLAFWKALPKDNGAAFHFYAKFLGGKLFGYARSETYESAIELSNQSSINETVPSKTMPIWFKDASRLWAGGQIRNLDYVYGIQNLIDHKIIKSNYNLESITIPSWIRNDANWLANGKISNDDYTKMLEYLINNKIIQ